jgi:SurA-like N-terminal domain
MMIKIFYIALLLLLPSSLLHSQHSFMFGNEPKLIINNRILANVNGKPISVIDAMKKMDVIFFRQFPQFRNSIEARTQFYQNGWKDTLQQLIDKELIVADAAEAKLEVSNGDIRQEMENMFGPNIIDTLDSMGLPFEDAWNIVKDEIIIRRMLYYRVNNRAIKKVTPQLIHESYEEFAKKNPRSGQWNYTVISVTDKNLDKSAHTAEQIYALVTEEKVPLFELIETLQQRGLVDESTRINVSSEISVSENEISESHKNILNSLDPKSFTEPVAQKSRSDNSTVYRIFYLNDRIMGGVIPFQEVEQQLISQLTDHSIAKESEAYLKRLRRHFRMEEDDLKEMIPSDFQPFVMR